MNWVNLVLLFADCPIVFLHMFNYIIFRTQTVINSETEMCLGWTGNIAKKPLGRVGILLIIGILNPHILESRPFWITADTVEVD